MKPNVYTRHHDFYHSHLVNRYECSQCECYLNENWKYCPICGEKIDWDDENINIIDIYISLRKNIKSLTDKNKNQVHSIYIEKVKDKISLETLNRIHIPSHITEISDSSLMILFIDLIADEYYSYMDFMTMVDIVCNNETLKNNIYNSMQNILKKGS